LCAFSPQGENAPNSHKAASTELIGEAGLSARNIFLSGGYALSPGTLMTASGALATHTSLVSDPYVGLTAPGYSGCTKTRFALPARITERASPGIYCGGIVVEEGAVLELAPGTAILDQGN
jgi:hypothetical protein